MLKDWMDSTILELQQYLSLRIRTLMNYLFYCSTPLRDLQNKVYDKNIREESL